MNSVRSEVKAAGIVDTNENVWDFFIEKVRRNLHICLCFSPVGDAFRVRARKFPALVNNTMIDWYVQIAWSLVFLSLLSSTCGTIVRDGHF